MRRTDESIVIIERMVLLSMFLDILKKPTLWDILVDLMILTVPLWIAVLVGVVLGWSWRPQWANFGREWTLPSLGCFDSVPSFGSFRLHLPSFVPWIASNGLEEGASSPPNSSKSNPSSAEHTYVNDADLRHLRRLVEVKDEGPAWIPMMDRSIPTMTYQACRRDPQIGPPQYRSRTIFEDVTPEIVRDFFWDDEFRFKWDDMLVNHKSLEECLTTGTMIVHWIRKFPFFCSDREYVIGRRIWECERSYYCVTKGVPCSSLPRRNKPRRVDLYYSSWCIRPAESRRGDGQSSACEVILFHHEDMGIPWEIAKLGVRQGMWGAVKKIDPGLRAYQKDRACGFPLSHCALMAHINTRVSMDFLQFLEDRDGHDLATVSVVFRDSSSSSENPTRMNIPKILVVGGAIALACSLDQGLLTKAIIFGVARRFARIGRKL